MASIKPETTEETKRPVVAGDNPMLSTKVVTWSLGLFGAVTFVVCVVYGLIVHEPLRMAGFLEAVLPAFHWLTLGGLVIGLVESFLYGVYAGLVFTPIYNALSRRWTGAR